ncbi:Fe-S protein assembly co-chaperone HscB [Candidatus Sneabacter namystus]|uniref:Fe-S protein assembly co-chaperone HscB n=1 Tax=Candidatus Sneabacter namystus TaxID=2601646 RepID=A0A5C0UIF9_9RICK|nr:Fe-S protein assembly co-chaperone HscB [Candidatus Sneabacter namystus]QEK39567.1 Fe-S protein assembly co-chaperone HscB [Candidatus Sneabacter namystus]
MKDMNYFEVLGFSIRFGIDDDELEERYMKLQEQFHPDKATTAQERRAFLSMSLSVNTAYRNLKDIFSRARHILQLKGVDMAHYSSSRMCNLLEDMLNDNLEMEKIHDIDSLKIFIKEKKEEKINVLSCMARAFEEDDIDLFAVYTAHFNYLTNILSLSDKKQSLLSISSD